MPDKKLERIYGQYYAFNKKQNEVGDTTNISFDILAPCCLSFTGHVELVEDTLKVKFYETKGDFEKCECVCDYRMFYTVDKTDKKWSVIKIEYSL